MIRRAARACGVAARAALGLALVAAPPAAAQEAAGPAPPHVAAAPPRPWIDADAPARSLADRLEEIRRRIESELVYPPGARWREREGAAVVAFTIASDGRAREIRLVRSSGEALLDRAAQRAVAAAHDLPYVWGPLEIPVRFTLAGAR